MRGGDTNDTIIGSDSCQHHWRIETPNGPTSLGRCRKCGAKGEFKNSSRIQSGRRLRPRDKQLIHRMALGPMGSAGHDDPARLRD